MDIDAMIRFIQEAERLKAVHRTAWTSDGQPESTAAHSWRLALLAGLLLDAYPTLDAVKVLMMALIHDLGELYDGDVSATLAPDAAQKYRTEQAAVQTALSRLDDSRAQRLFALWQEYEEGATPEARLVKALDKAETILQHNQGQNPPDFDYRFNLHYGKPLFEEDALLRQLRERLDAGTSARLNASGGTVTSLP